MEDAEEQTTATAEPTPPTPQAPPADNGVAEPTTPTPQAPPADNGVADHDDGPKDITNVAKGKRTKRHRPQSPIRFTFTSSNNNDLTYSPVSSSGYSAVSITLEEEDTAESLILLSKGQAFEIPRKTYRDDYDGIFKFNSKKYIQSPVNGTAGMFVYECKTCGRTFPSFQALGGHRASHKKPRNTNEIRKPLPYMAIIDEPYMKSSSRLHECSICGTEFNSGQALGGHMRRHRVTNGRNKSENHNGITKDNINTTTTLSLIPYNMVTTSEVYDRTCKNDALCLSLDLNLPARPETMTTPTNDNIQPKKHTFELLPEGENDNQQLPPAELSTAPTLVDCHY